MTRCRYVNVDFRRWTGNEGYTPWLYPYFRIKVFFINARSPDWRVIGPMIAFAIFLKVAGYGW